MVSSIATIEQTSPWSGKIYLLSYMEDMRLSCTCRAFSIIGDCKHCHTPVARDFAQWCFEHRGIKPFYTRTPKEELVAPSPSRPSSRYKLTDIWK